MPTTWQWNDVENLPDKLLETFRSPDYNPPKLPEVAHAVLALTSDPDASIARFVQLLERDQLIAGNVLKMANSVFYCPAAGAEVASLQRAVVRLGLDALRDIVLEIWAQLHVFSSKTYSAAMRRLSRHSSVTAHATTIVAKHAALDTDHAFLCGLMHDAGIAGALSLLGDSTQAEPPKLSAVRDDLDLVHEELSGIMVDLWALPGEVATVVRHHHSYVIDEEFHAMAGAVCLAEEMANRIGFTVDEEDGWSTLFRPLDATHPQAIDRALQLLDLDKDDEARILAEVEDAVERLSWLHD
jgi:HD-like signal output (HDOD) protein